MVWNIIIGISSFLAFVTIWQVIKHFKFVVTFTDEMISLGIISPSVRKQLLLVEGIGSSFLHVIAQTISFIGLYFNTSMGIKIYAVVAVITLLVFRPTRDRYTRSRYTINQYIQAHSVCMNLDRMRELF